MSTPDPVGARAREAPGATALVHPGGHWSYRDLDRRVDSAARRLSGLPRRKAGRIALVAGNGPGTVVVLHAAARAGREIAPLNPGLTPRELGDALATLAPDAVIADAGSLPAVGAAVDRLTGSGRRPRTVVLGAGSGEEAPGDAVPFASLPEEDGAPEPLAGDRVRAVLWTSGTTGRPRGVLLTGDNLEASARGAARRLSLTPGDRWYASLSVAHVGGLALVTRAAYLGSTVVVRGGFDDADFLRLADAGEITHASLVPVMLRRVLDRPAGDEGPEGRSAPAALRLVLLGGAATPDRLLERALDRGFPVALTYGQTEASSQIATAPPGRVEEKPGSVGRALPGVELRLDEGGEIRVRGPTVAAGYLGDEPFPLDADGWLRTGDLGRIDDDGDLWITGRLRSRIVSGGVSVDPAEVEAVLRTAPGVEDAVVVGVPDAEWGESVAAVVVAVRDGAADPDALRRHCRARLAGPKRPRRLRLVDSLPRTATGKVDRDGARRLFSPSEPGDGP